MQKEITKENIEQSALSIVKNRLQSKIWQQPVVEIIQVSETALTTKSKGSNDGKKNRKS